MISPSGSRPWFKGIRFGDIRCFWNFFYEKIAKHRKISLANGESEKRYVYRKINNGQATKGARRMPWHWEPMKDVVSCDKPWGGANIL